jgi:outer membrane protein assembly factor BamB
MTLRAVGLTVLICTGFGLAGQDAHWPQWRGPRQAGHAPLAKNLPVSFSETENVLWKAKMPSWSAATPVIWGDTVYVTTAEAGFVNPTYDTRALRKADEPSNDKIFLLALRRADGKEKWRVEIDQGNRLWRKQNSASPSPIVDGKHIWTMTGHARMRCYTLDGKLVWKRDLIEEYGEIGINHGYASTPLLDAGVLYVNVIHGFTTDKPSYVMAVDALTGKNKWRFERPAPAQRESKDSYSTPQMAVVGGKKQLIVTGADIVNGYDPATGKELWRIGGFNPTNNPANRTIASGLVLGDLVVWGASRGRPYIAFRAGGSGDLTGKAEVWTNNLGPDVPTPATDGKYIYVLNDKGIYICLEAATGKVIYEGQRIELGTYSSSPLLADGKLYATNEDGVTTVVAAGPEFKVLGTGKLAGYTLASPAAVDNQLFIRTGEALYAIGRK